MAVFVLSKTSPDVWNLRCYQWAGQSECLAYLKDAWTEDPQQVECVLAWMSQRALYPNQLDARLTLLSIAPPELRERVELALLRRAFLRACE